MYYDNVHFGNIVLYGMDLNARVIKLGQDWDFLAKSECMNPSMY